MVARLFWLGRNRDHLIQLTGEFAQKGIHAEALDLGVDTLPLMSNTIQMEVDYIGAKNPGGDRLAARSTARSCSRCTLTHHLKVLPSGTTAW